MEDEAGGDAKLVAVPPHDKLTQTYHNVREIEDLPELLRDQIRHFFENYKTLEPGKWVKVQGWDNAAAAKKAIEDAINAYKADCASTIKKSRASLTTARLFLCLSQSSAEGAYQPPRDNRSRISLIAALARDR